MSEQQPELAIQVYPLTPDRWPDLGPFSADMARRGAAGACTGGSPARTSPQTVAPTIAPSSKLSSIADTCRACSPTTAVNLSGGVRLLPARNLCLAWNVHVTGSRLKARGSGRLFAFTSAGAIAASSLQPACSLLPSSMHANRALGRSRAIRKRSRNAGSCRLDLRGHGQDVPGCGF
jgi:hypothetical protein